MSIKDLLSTPIGGKSGGDKPGKKPDRKSAKKPGGKSGEKAGLSLKGKLGGKLGKKGRQPSARSLPVKRSINLAVIGEKKPINFKIALPGIVLIIVAAMILSKFLVVDRLVDMYHAQGDVSSMQSELSASYQKLNSFGDMTQEYAHYTYSYMSNEELNRTDRVEVLDLLQRIVLPQSTLSSWSVTGNILTLNIARESLQGINLLAQDLNDDPLVNFCTITTAATTNNRSDTEQRDVAGQIVVYLNSTAEKEDEAQ